MAFVKEKDVSEIAAGYLCNSCGACAAVCGYNAIGYKESTGGYLFPEIEMNSCKKCGKCLKVCPGQGLGRTLKDRMPQDPFTGDCIRAFTGKSTDTLLFNNSQSGGVAAALLKYLFETKKIDAAIVAVMKRSTPPRGDVAIIRTIGELVNVQKSKYTPIPLLKVVKDLKATGERFAIVGLSCHMHGLSNIVDIQSSLKEKIILRIGLICDGILNTSAIDFLCKDYERLQPDHLVFRDKNRPSYPGSLVIESQKGIQILPPQRRMELKRFFTPVRCRICFDKMNIFSDVTIGDPHGIAGVDRKRGESAVITRTDRGNLLVNAALSDKVLELREIDAEAVFKGQKISVKREIWREYSSAWKVCFSSYPDFGDKLEKLASGTKAFPKELKLLRKSANLDRFKNRNALIRSYKRLLFVMNLPALIKSRTKKIRQFSFLRKGNIWL